MIFSQIVVTYKDNEFKTVPLHQEVLESLKKYYVEKYGADSVRVTPCKTQETSVDVFEMTSEYWTV